MTYTYTSSQYVWTSVNSASQPWAWFKRVVHVVQSSSKLYDVVCLADEGVQTIAWGCIRLLLGTVVNRPTWFK